MADRFSCSVFAREIEEPLYGTASQVRRWILVEQPGSWGTDAIATSLPEDVATRLRAAARAVGARLLLIRRHGRSNPVVRNCFVAVTTADTRRIERFVFTDPAELLDIDWAPLRQFQPVGGDPVNQPLYLVCTNGSHDTCCARFGRPVAAVLDSQFEGLVWESSHFGGDRFAGNVVFLPDGIYYGRVSPENAVELVEQQAAGHLSLDNFRGRSFEPFVAQAAEHFVRTDRGLLQVDDVIAGGVEDLGHDWFRVRLDTAAGESLTATIERADSEHPQQLTCRSSSEERPPRYRLVALE